MERFCIAVVKFYNNKTTSKIFENRKKADLYYRRFVKKIVRWILIEYEFGKPALIHDCAGDGIYNLNNIRSEE